MALATSRYRGSGVRNATVLYDNAGVVAEHTMLFVRNVTPEPTVNTLAYEGDDVAENVDTLVGFDVVIELDKFDLATISRIFNKQAATAITGEDLRVYFGDNSEVGGGIGGLQYDVVVRDHDTGTTETLRYTFPRGSWKMFRPPAATYNTKHGVTLRFTAEKTTVDVAGDALPSVPADGAFFYLSQMT